MKPRLLFRDLLFVPCSSRSVPTGKAPDAWPATGFSRAEWGFAENRDPNPPPFSRCNRARQNKRDASFGSCVFSRVLNLSIAVLHFLLSCNSWSISFSASVVPDFWTTRTLSPAREPHTSGFWELPINRRRHQGLASALLHATNNPIILLHFPIELSDDSSAVSDTSWLTHRRNPRASHSSILLAKSLGREGDRNGAIPACRRWPGDGRPAQSPTHRTPDPSLFSRASVNRWLNTTTVKPIDF